MKKEVGNEGENLACQFLQKLNYEILERNWFNHEGKMLGEIDIIAKNSVGKIVFVEVKTRKVSFFNEINKETFPEEQITLQKMSKLQKIAEKYIQEKNLWQFDWQFDAVLVIIFSQKNLKPKIYHLENIFF